MTPASGSPRRSERGLPIWLPWLHLGCALLAGAIWYLEAQAGPWPLILVLAPWLLQCLLTRRLSERSGFELPLLLFLASTVVGAWAAFDRPGALPKLWRIAGGVGIFYALRAASPLGRKRVGLLAGFGAAVAIYFLATHDWAAYPAKIAALTRLGVALQGPLPSTSLHRLHPNVAGGILAMMAPFAGLVTFWSWRRLRDAPAAYRSAGRAAAWLTMGLALGALLLILFGLLMSTSRGAWIALGCALWLGGSWWLSRRAARSAPALGRWLFPLSLGALLAAALALVLARPAGIAALLRALPGPETGASRIELLRNSMSLVRDYAFTGAGLGGFQMLYSTYALFLHVGYSVHSHNLLVNVAVEQGLPGAVALLWMWANLGASVVRQMIGARPGSPRAGVRSGDESAGLAVAALCLVVVLVHGLVDDVLYGSRAVLLLFVPLAFCGSREGGQGALTAVRQWGKRRELVLPLELAALLALALFLRKPLLSHFFANLGAVHQSQAELGVYSWPEWPLQDEVRRRIDLARPIGEFERALGLDPGNATANRRLGMIDLSTGRYEQALTLLEAAYAREAHSDVTRSLLAEAYVVNGRPEEGRAMFAQVGNTAGRLAARSFWYGYIGDEERHEWMSQAVEGR